MEQAGLDENFVQAKGETDKSIHVSNSLDDDSENEDHCIAKSETQQRYEVDMGGMVHEFELLNINYLKNILFLKG